MEMDPADLPTGTLLDALPLSVAVVDPEGTIVWTDQTWREFGVANDGDADLVGENYIAVSEAAEDDEYARQAATGIRELLAGDREQFSLEYPCHSPDEQRWFLMWAAPLDHEGQRFAVVAHFDITERRLAEKEVGEAATELKKDRERLALLNRIVRHDIRNDMEVVIGWAEALEDHVTEDGEQYLDQILSASNHVIDLIEDMGDLTDVIASDEDPDLRPVDLGVVLDAELRKLTATAHDTALTVGGDEAIPTGVPVVADEMLSTVFANVLGNAVEHGGEEVHVDVTVAVDAETVTVTIADDGPGIPPKRRESVFGRGESGIDSDGTGVGLYLVDTLVDLYDGRVWIEESSAGGTAVVIELPRFDPEADRERVATTVEEGTGRGSESDPDNARTPDGELGAEPASKSDTETDTLSDD